MERHDGAAAFLFERVYSAPVVTDEVAKATHLVGDLFDYYVAHTGEVPQEYRAISEGDDLRAVTDFIAGMTDRYAKNLYQQLVHPATRCITRFPRPKDISSLRRCTRIV